MTDRQKTLEWFKNRRTAVMMSASKKMYNEAVKALEELEKRGEGKWIRRDCGLDVECKCSKCGYRDFVEPRDEYWFKRNYCPNCGAKMTEDTT